MYDQDPEPAPKTARKQTSTKTSIVLDSGDREDLELLRAVSRVVGKKAKLIEKQAEKIEKLEERVGRLADSMTGKDKQIKHLMNDLVKQNSNVDVDKMNRILAGKEDELRKMREQNELYVQQIRVLEERLLKHDDEDSEIIQKLNNVQEQQEKAIDDLEEAVASRDLEIHSLKQRLSQQAPQQLAEHVQQMKELAEQKERTKVETDSKLKQRVDEVEKEVGEKQKQIQSLTTQLTATISDLEKFKEKVTEKEREVVSWKEKGLAAQREIEEMRREIGRLTQVNNNTFQQSQRGNNTSNNIVRPLPPPQAHTPAPQQPHQPQPIPAASTLPVSIPSVNPSPPVQTVTQGAASPLPTANPQHSSNINNHSTNN